MESGKSEAYIEDKLKISSKDLVRSYVSASKCRKPRREQKPRHLKFTEPGTGMFRIIPVRSVSVMNVKRNIQHAIGVR